MKKKVWQLFDEEARVAEVLVRTYETAQVKVINSARGYEATKLEDRDRILKELTAEKPDEIYMSPRLEAWLINHPRLGPSVVAWRENGAIPRKIKYIAIGSMSVSFLIVLVIHLSTMWTAIIGVAMLASALFVATRPEGSMAAR